MSELKRSIEGVEDNEQTEQPPKKIRIKTRKFALMFCYSGDGYYGLQRNEPYKTIEGEFLKTLLKLQIIDQERFDKPKLFHFQRAARTDKGVSAIRQVISCKMLENFPEKLPEVNENLPEEIRLVAAKRVTPMFDCRNFCDSRTYSYTFPTFTISPPKTILSTYHRVDTQLIDKCNQLLSKYKGTHNFHNFTSGKAANDKSSMRYIIDMNCSQPFEYEEMEFAKITVKGQSFMLHQIRKMIGLVFAIMRGYVDESKIEESFLKNKQDIPIAPGLGLLLENVHYDTYNRRYTGNGIHEPLDWDEFNKEINEFRHKFIFRNIYEQEKKKFSMMNWLDTLQLHKNNTNTEGFIKDEIKTDDNDQAIDNLNNEKDEKIKIEEEKKLKFKQNQSNGFIEQKLNENEMNEKELNESENLKNDDNLKSDKISEIGDNNSSKIANKQKKEEHVI